MKDFKFIDCGVLSDGEIELVVKHRLTVDKAKENGYPKGYPPQYTFDVRLAGKPEAIGWVQLRIGRTKWVTTQSGNVGYEISESYRGHRYAAKACNLVKQVALEHGLKTLWITCNPDNITSRRTSEILGCELVEIVDLPADTDMYQRGERKQCRYRWDLGELKND